MRTSWLRVRTPVLSNNCCRTAFHIAFRNLQARSDLFVRQAFEDSFQNRALAAGQRLRRLLRLRFIAHARHERADSPRIEPHLSASHLLYRFDQLRRRAVLQEDPSGAALESPQRARIAHAGRDHQDAATQATAFGFIQKSRTLLIAQIVIEQNDIRRLSFHRCQSVGHRSAGGDNAEFRLSFE